jgi:hypothetical protein
MYTIRPSDSPVNNVYSTETPAGGLVTSSVEGTDAAVEHAVRVNIASNPDIKNFRKFITDPFFELKNSSTARWTSAAWQPRGARNSCFHTSEEIFSMIQRGWPR